MKNVLKDNLVTNSKQYVYIKHVRIHSCWTLTCFGLVPGLSILVKNLFIYESTAFRDYNNLRSQ